MASHVTEHGIPDALPPELHPDVSQLVTEDDVPVDNIFSEKQQRLLTEPLYSSWGDPETRRRFVALANVGLFYSIHEPPFVPDMLLSLDVEVPADLWPKSHRCYFVWEYGKLPDVVIEVVSNREGGEAGTKLASYARIGVTYYVILDPQRLLSNDLLRGFQREGMVYRPMTEPLWFPGVELGLRLWQGTFEGHQETWLRWVNTEGEFIRTGAEQRHRADQEGQRAEQERHRADQEGQRAEEERHRAEQEGQRAEQERHSAEQERRRAEQERQRADQERQRVEKLEEQLRRLGADPEA